MDLRSLYQKFEILLSNTPVGFKRYLYDDVSWNSRLVGIIGPRGVGKTTMILQYIKENLGNKRALYISADDLYFGKNKLYDLAEYFYTNAGECLFIDEIHKYADWSRELKNIYDAFPDLNVVFTGSSILDILKGSDDLSRRAIIYQMQGLSFREYLNFYHKLVVEVHDLEKIVNGDINTSGVKHPLPLFKDYLRKGYYPFGHESEIHLRLGQVVLQTLEIDIPQYASMNVSTSRKLKSLLAIIAESAPFKPNRSKIAGMLNVSRNSLEDYLDFMEKAGLISQLRSEIGGIRRLGKVEKVYLDNANLIFSLVGEKANVGNIRETFFVNQMRVKNEVYASKNADFVIGDYTFEVGGKSKNQKQIEDGENSFVVKDDIEYAYLNVLPLWAFGLNY